MVELGKVFVDVIDVLVTVIFTLVLGTPGFIARIVVFIQGSGGSCSSGPSSPSIGTGDVRCILLVITVRVNDGGRPA
jgi:hypothetical protein